MTKFIDARPTIAAPDDDPHLWLEEIEGAKAVAWADAQSAATYNAIMTLILATSSEGVAAVA